MVTVNLSPEPIRKFSDRECAHLICGLIGTLYYNTDPATLDRAIKWVNDNRETVLLQLARESRVLHSK